MAIKEIMKKIQSTSITNVLKISSGTIGGQLISMIGAPIYTRLFGASVLGTWALYSSIAIIITSFSDAGLKNAIMIEDSDNTEELYTVISTLTFLVSCLAGIVCGFLNFYGVLDTGMSSVLTGFIVWLISFTISQTDVCYTWLNKKGEYNVLMKNPLINNGVAAVLAIILGIAGFKSYGYYLATIAGQVVTLIHMKTRLPKAFFNFNVQTYKKIIQEKKEFYLYQMPANFLGQFKEQIPVILIGNFFGKEVLGYYSISMKYLKMPVTFLAQSIGKVFLKNVSDLFREKKAVGEYTLKNIARAMNLAVIPMICIYAFGDLACIILFGNDFSESGTILRLVASNSYFLFMLTSCQGLSVVLHKQKYQMLVGIAQIIGYTIGLSIGYYVFNDIYVGCFCMSVIYAIIQIVFFCALFEAANIRFTRYLKKLGINFLVIVIGAAVIRIPLLMLGIVSGI